MEIRSLQLAPEALVPRVVQHHSKRFSLRLERVFWNVLEAAARDRNFRIGALVAEIGKGSGGQSLASRLRVFCILEMQRGLADQALYQSSGLLYRLLSSAPSPGLLLGPDQSILVYNEALASWLGKGRDSIVGMAFSEVFQIRTRRSFGEIWRDLGIRDRESMRIPLVYVAPGRAAAVTVTMTPVRDGSSRRNFVLVWLHAAPR